MIPSGYNAWKRDEAIQQWFEVVFDTPYDSYETHWLRMQVLRGAV